MMKYLALSSKDIKTIDGRNLELPYGMNFMVAGRAMKNFYYYVAKILICFDSVKFKIC